MTESNHLEDEGAAIVEHAPEDLLEAKQLFATLDKVRITDEAFVQIMNLHKELFKSVLEKVDKT